MIVSLKRLMYVVPVRSSPWAMIPMTTRPGTAAHSGGADAEERKIRVDVSGPPGASEGAHRRGGRLIAVRDIPRQPSRPGEHPAHDKAPRHVSADVEQNERPAERAAGDGGQQQPEWKPPRADAQRALQHAHSGHDDGVHPVNEPERPRDVQEAAQQFAQGFDPAADVRWTVHQGRPGHAGLPLHPDRVG